MFKNPIPQDNAKSAQPWIAIVMAILVPTVVVVNYNAGFKQIWPFTAVVSIAFIIAAYDNFRRNREMFFGLSVVLLMIHAGTLYILNHGASAFLVPIFLVPLSAPLIIRSVKTLFWSELVLTLLFLFFGIYGYRNFELPFSAILISPIAFLSINFTQRNSLKKKVKLKEQTTIIERQLTELKKQQKILEEKSNTIETKSLALKKTNEHLEQFTYIISHDL